MPEPPFKQNALWQLNLMLWLSLPGYAVKPVFYDAGFEIYLVEEVITVPEAALLRANSTIPPVLITSRPNPDLVLRHNVNQSLLPIECKVSSFSSTSKKIKQANAILEVIAQPWIGPRIWRQRSLARGCAMTSKRGCAMTSKRGCAMTS